eukprot:737045-Prymnesium_polylepis.1
MRPGLTFDTFFKIAILFGSTTPTGQTVPDRAPAGAGAGAERCDRKRTLRAHENRRHRCARAHPHTRRSLATHRVAPERAAAVRLQERRHEPLSLGRVRVAAEQCRRRRVALQGGCELGSGRRRGGFSGAAAQPMKR